MKQSIVDAVNEQIRIEFNSAFLYLSLSVELKEYGLPGAGHWLREQYREECGHALRLVTYLEKRQAKIIVPEVNRLVCEWNTPLDVFRLALEHERRVSDAINDLLTLCRTEKDYATQNLMFDYVMEQVEEENSVQDILDMFEKSGGSPNALLRIDAQLGRRDCKDGALWG